MDKIEKNKTRKLIEAIEKKCLNICNDQKCSDYSIDKDEKALCSNCKINKYFTEIVGISMEEI